MAAAGGGTEKGTRIILERDTDRLWQEWTIRRSAWNGSISFIPGHAPGEALDDLGGGTAAGSKQDIWSYDPMDEHLQWTLTPLPGATYPADLPRPGTIREMTFTESRIFPGTTRKVTVFVPAQYDGSRPACVYVRQDGFGSKEEKGMLEALIAAKAMPVTIGVFVTPGDLPAPMAGTLGRRNRSLEYDGMGDAYVRFLIEEILPFVSAKLGLKLSDSGNDRCIAGSSSGGIAALNAAWERPDAFSRVYANSGSFVAFRGGSEFPTLIRKTEAKPIRAYVTTGTHDMENRAGDWYLLDQEVDKALAFSGYDYVFRAIEGGHGAGWNECFPEAMRFLWKDWPEPVRAGPSAPRVRDVIVPGQGWEPVDQGCPDARGPASNSRGEVFFVDAGENTIRRIGLDGSVTVFAADAGRADSLCCGPHDELFSVSSTTGRIVRYDASGRGRLFAAGIRGRCAVATADGGLYVSGPGPKGDEDSRVWLVKGGRKTLVDSGLKRATGLALRPDRWLLAVAEGASKWVTSCKVDPDGTLSDKERYFWLHVADRDDDAGAESICFTREGLMLVATRLGVQVCADDGPTVAIIPAPGGARVIGLCLGGPDHGTLYAFCGAKTWKRVVRVHGVGAFSPWTAVTATPL
jgi:enterochelin esterase-like enzyme/sugar lactone lactonase YvrE